MQPPNELVEGCRLIDLPVVSDRRGNLTFVETQSEVPFDIRRVYYLYDVPGGEQRAGHAHLALQQLVIAVAGSFDVLLDDGHKRSTVSLNRAHKGLFMSNAVWREISNFSSGAVCLVLASMEYDEDDYIRDYDDFLRHVGGGERAEIQRLVDDGLGQHTIG
jgi:dTDP-4-dehydrorhamnose 3,5-epimerase-like enzyme